MPVEGLLDRITVVGGALFVVAAVIVLLRWRAKAPRRISATGLEPGIYLFTSQTCPDCGPARETLFRVLGPERVKEIRWEDRPDVFKMLGVKEVPATLVVHEGGRGRIWPGQPDRMLVGLGP